MVYSGVQPTSPRGQASNTSFMAIFAEVTENECIIDEHVHDIDTLRDSL